MAPESSGWGDAMVGGRVVNPLTRSAAALALLAVACRGAPPRATVDLLVDDGQVIDPSSCGPPALEDIAVDDGIILAIGTGLERRYAPRRVLDARGQYVIPGLADMHTHFGTGVRGPEEDDTTPVLARLLDYGVTTTLNLGSFEARPGRIDALRAAMRAGTLHGPRLLAAAPPPW